MITGEHRNPLPTIHSSGLGIGFPAYEAVPGTVCEPSENELAQFRERLTNLYLKLDVPTEDLVPAFTYLRRSKLLVDVREALQCQIGKPYPCEEALLKITAALPPDCASVIMGIHTSPHSVVDRTLEAYYKRLAMDHPDGLPFAISHAIPSTQAAAVRAIALMEPLASNPGNTLQVHAFLPIEPGRRDAQQWNMDHIYNLAQTTQYTIRESGQNIQMIGVLEQGTQVHPEELLEFILMYIQLGYDGICIADSISLTNPQETYELMKAVRTFIDENAPPQFEVQFHGHNDSGDAPECALAAMLAAGAEVHVTPLGIGERAGNADAKVVSVYKANLLGDNTYDPESYDRFGETFLEVTKANPSIYGPGEENALYTGAELHLNYLRKIRMLLRELESNRDTYYRLIDELGYTEEDATSTVTELLSQRLQGIVRSMRTMSIPEVYAYLKYLNKTAYLGARMPGYPDKLEHKVGLNAFSCDDATILALENAQQELGVHLPQKIIEKLLAEILDLLKNKNKPVSSEDLKGMIKNQYQDKINSSV